MKIRLLSAAAMLCLASGLALAQQPPHGPPGRNIEDLAVLLDLNDGQKAAVDQVLQGEREEMFAARKAAKDSGTRPSFEEMHAKHAAMQKETLAKLRPILNDSQMKKFQILSEHPAGPPRGFGKRPGRQKPDDSSSSSQ
jgi:hypothetical protein